MNRHNKSNAGEIANQRAKKPANEIHPDAEVKPPKSEDDVLDVIEGVEQQLGALRNAHAEHRAAMSELMDRRRKIEEKAEELEAMESELGTREVELAEMRQEFEQREIDLVQRAQGLEQRESKIAVQAESLERKEAEVEAEQSKVADRLSEIDEQLGALRDQKAEVEAREAEAIEKLQREDEAAAELTKALAELKASENKLRGREIELSERSKALEELAEQTGALDAELGETKQELAKAISTAQEHMVREQKVNEGLRAQLEKLADEGVESQELQEKVDLLSTRLEEANSELVEVRNHAKRSLEAEQGKLAELNEQIVLGQQQISDLNEQIAGSNAHAKKLSDELELTKAMLSDAPSPEALDQAKNTINELRQQLAQSSESSGKELAHERERSAALDKQLKEVQRSLDAISAERNTLKKELESRAQMGSDELKALQSRFQETTAKLKQVSEQLEQASGKHHKLRGQSAEQAKQLEVSAQKINELEQQSETLASKVAALTEELEIERNTPKGVDVDEWNAHRRERLGRVRSALKANSDKIRRATDALRDRYDQCEQVLVKRAELAEAYQAVAEAQSKYQNREVRSSVFLGLTGIGFLVLVMAGISWFVAGRIAPGEYAARVTIVANAGNRALSEEDAASWGAYMETLTSDPQFIEFAAERMKRRGILAMGVPGELSRQMRESLDVISATPGQLELEYRGEGSERSQRVLDTFAVALTSAANNARARRTDGATATIPEVAVAGAQPLDTHRIEMAGMVFGGSMLGSLILGGLLWTRLSAAKSRFDRDSRIEPLLDDSQWQMPGS